MHAGLSPEIRPARQSARPGLHQAADRPQPRKRKGKDGAGLFDIDKGDAAVEVDDGEIIPDVEITEAEYRKNPLAADVKYWGYWILSHA